MYTLLSSDYMPSDWIVDLQQSGREPVLWSCAILNFHNAKTSVLVSTFSVSFWVENWICINFMVICKELNGIFRCTYRNLNHNQLSGDITDIFSNLPSLTTVWVFPLFNPIVTELALYTLVHISNICFIWLYFCWNCHRDLSSNSLTGNLPQSFTSLSSLKTL